MKKQLIIILSLICVILKAQPTQTVNWSVQLAGGDNSWQTTNATKVPLLKQMVLNTTTGQYKIGDGVTQLQNLSYYGGSLSSYVPYVGASSFTTSNNITAQSFISTSSSTVPVLVLNPASSSTISGSLYYDNAATGTGLTARTNSTNGNFAFSVTNGSITGGMIPLQLSGASAAYNGLWIGTPTVQNVHLVSRIYGGGLPALTVSSQTSGAIGGILINGPNTYTTTSSLDIYDGGGVDNIRSATSANAETFRLEKTTGNAYFKGRAVIGSTVATTANTLTVNGGVQITGTLNLGSGSGTLTGGNSGTISVFTDNLFTISASFPIQALSASTSYYWTTNALGVRTTVGQSTMTIPYNCTLVGASISAWNSPNTASQTNSTLNFRLNGSDNVISSSVLWPTSSNTSNNINVTGLNISITAGDAWENKLTLGALATAPSNGNCTVIYYFARR